mgnify:CR=1 FL=1
MICFPNAKINLGLNIVEKRIDGFHNIETIMLPIPLRDVLEFRESKDFKINVYNSSAKIKLRDNTIYRSWKKLSDKFGIPSFEVSLIKNIPSEAGLGGGSSDAAFFIKELNTYLELGLSESTMEDLLVDIGSDCPFFIKNKAAFAQSKGEVLKPVDLELKGKHLSIVKPKFGISTKEAYQLVKISIPEKRIPEIISTPIESWKNILTNDFETAISPLYPELNHIYTVLYKKGSSYVSLSGSGPSIFAISNHKLDLSAFSNLFTKQFIL